MKVYKILFIEDDVVVRKTYELFLQKEQYDVVCADSAEAALQFLDADVYDIIMSDNRLDKMSGLELLKIVKDKYPDSIRILLTGHPDLYVLEHAINEGEIFRFIKKPVSFSELSGIMKQAIDFLDLKYQNRELFKNLEKKVIERSEELYESEKKLRTLFDTMVQGVIYFDINGDILSANKSAQRILGIPENNKEIMNVNILFENAVNEETIKLDTDSSPFSIALKTGKEVNDNIIGILNRDDSEFHWLNVNILPQHHSGDDKPYLIYATFEDITYRKTAEKHNIMLMNELGERVKELSCLYKLSQIIEIPDITLHQVFQKTAEIIPPGWQFPERTHARLTLEGVEFYSSGFRESEFMQEADIKVFGEKVGSIEVFRTEFDVNGGVNPFLPEEDNLVSALAQRLGILIERLRAEEELEKSRKELRNLSVYLQTVRENERTRISREIHDELGQSLTALKMDLSLLCKKIPDIKKYDARIESMNLLIDSTINTVQKISSELRPGILDNLGLSSAIEWQAIEFQKRTEINCQLNLCDDDFDQDIDLSTTIFRIFQETLTNVARHSKAANVNVSLTRENGCIFLKVDDDGIGITNEQVYYPNSLGLIGIRERALSVGGEVSIFGKKGKGTTVISKIPVNKGMNHD